MERCNFKKPKSAACLLTFFSEHLGILPGLSLVPAGYRKKELHKTL